MGWRTVAIIEASLRAYTGCDDPPTGDLAELQGVVNKLLVALAHEMADAERDRHRFKRAVTPTPFRPEEPEPTKVTPSRLPGDIRRTPQPRKRVPPPTY